MKRLFVLMVLLSSFFLSSMAGLINFISFPEGKTWYYSGVGAFKSIMMAKVYFFKNSKGEKMIKYKPHISNKAIYGKYNEMYNEANVIRYIFKLETGIRMSFSYGYKNFKIKTGYNDIDMERIPKEEYDMLVSNFNRTLPSGGVNSFGNIGGSTNHSGNMCSSCRGTGRCSGCNGQGKYWEQIGTYTGTDTRKYINCPVCRGSGRCGTCRGKGKL